MTYVHHVIPMGDLIEHESELADGCPCGPTHQPVLNRVGGQVWVAVHHSLDGREAGHNATPAEQAQRAMNELWKERRAHE